MLVTHEILSACFLLAFVATATPIPTPPHLLPRTLSDLPSDPRMMRDTAGTRNLRQIPEEERTTGKIEIRMESSGSSNNGTKGSDSEDSNEPEPGSGKYFQSLCYEMGKYLHESVEETVNKESAAKAKELASNLHIIKDHNIRDEVATSLIRFRIPYKQKVALNWPFVPNSKPTSNRGTAIQESPLVPDPTPTPEQVTAIQAIQLWEQQLDNWDKASYKRDVDLLKKTMLETIELIMQVPDVNKFLKTSWTQRAGLEVLKGRISTLMHGVSSMRIADAQKLHAQLQEVTNHVRKEWVSTWPVQNGRFALTSIQKNLEAIEKYVIVFGAASRSQTTSTTTTATATTSKTVAT
ncbi:hypothetical protein H0H93_005138 [Arthromyces matolae]|nr:hypothetical protein H0H93_005138 [Arthromyces matolae]